MTWRGLTLAIWATALAVLFLGGSAIEQWIPGTRLDVASQALTPPVGRVTVEVRNAGGVSGAARGATERLRSIGYDVVRFGNDDAFGLDSSVVLDRIGEGETAAAVARALGITRVESEPDTTLFVDVTVRLGATWSLPGTADEDVNGSGWLARLLERY